MLLIFIALALVLWLLICVYFYQAQDGIMYETDPKVPSLKRASVYAGQAVQINPDGEPEISNTSWYFPASKGMGTILFFHGNNGNIETRTGWMQFALAQGWGLMMVGYRGYTRHGVNKDTAATYTERFLNAFDLQYYLVENNTDAERITVAFEEAQRRKGPVVILVADEFHGFN